MIHIPQWTKIAENQTAAKSQFFWLQVASCEFRTARKKIITVLRFLGGKFELQIFSKDGPAIFRFVESFWARTTMAARTSTGWNRSLVL